MTAAEHPLVEARAEQEASDLNSKLAELVYQAIIDRLEKTGKVFVDDLEGYYPAEHLDRCRNLTPGQLGSLRGRRYIQPTSEYRKSAVPARKGGKSWVYEFTQEGREKLAGHRAGGRGKSSLGGLGTANATPSSVSGEQSGPTGAPQPKGPDRSTNPPVPSASADSGEGSGAPSLAPEPTRAYEPLSLLPEPDPELWAA